MLLRGGVASLWWGYKYYPFESVGPLLQGLSLGTPRLLQLPQEGGLPRPQLLDHLRRLQRSWRPCLKGAVFVGLVVWAVCWAPLEVKAGDEAVVYGGGGEGGREDVQP